ncbi:rhomboid family intramembrane serine protease [Rubrolithibacter danxiaensis]|uniref:rhomboid family intramembrane serine protease n=1 Tax=Rubrolithibacter danxiaensis TaxID=3390805 RepID=UPI003BF838A0
MPASWGYSPKVEKYIPLGEFPAEQYLVVALKAIENLGWKLSHLSESGLIAYTNLSWQSYTEEISIRIKSNFAIVKSECVGIQLLFNDYSKNSDNLDKFFNEFEYVEFHLKDVWNEEVQNYQERAALSSNSYFETAPLASKEKIRNVLHLFVPRKGYLVTPIIIDLNIIYFLFSFILLVAKSVVLANKGNGYTDLENFYTNFYYSIGANNRHLTLSGNFWRLTSNTFIHFSVLHLFSNTYALAYIGLMTENKLGPKKFLLAYLLSGICGSTLSLIYHPTGIMGGASGAIMGMFGVFLAMLATDLFEKNARKAMMISTALVIALMLFNGMGKQIDNAAHVGGLISGFIIGLLFTVKINNPPFLNTDALRYGAVITSISLIVSGSLYSIPDYQLERFKELNNAYLENQLLTRDVFSYIYYADKQEKLQHIKEKGVEPWDKNFRVTAEMERLKLPEVLCRKVKRMITYSRLQKQSFKLLYKECFEGTKKYRPEINNLTVQMNNIIREDLKDSNDKWLEYVK